MKLQQIKRKGIYDLFLFQYVHSGSKSSKEESREGEVRKGEKFLPVCTGSFALSELGRKIKVSRSSIQRDELKGIRNYLIKIVCSSFFSIFYGSFE